MRPLPAHPMILRAIRYRAVLSEWVFRPRVVRSKRDDAPGARKLRLTDMACVAGSGAAFAPPYPSEPGITDTKGSKPEPEPPLLPC